ncbi:TetR/AcrR family transcriptional regulator [soil metagenome]
MGGPADATPTGGSRRVRPPRRPRSDERTGATVDDIVGAAAALFRERGIQAVTMADIAERAGLRQPSLYYYFRSKIDVLGHILDDVNRIPLSIVDQARNAGGPVAVRLYWLIYQDVLALCRFPVDINEVHRLSAGHPQEFERYWVERQRLNDEVESLITAGVETAELRDVDARLAALTLLANDEGTQNWLRPVGAHRLRGRLDTPLGDYRPEEVADHTAEMALRHLLVRPSTLGAVRARALAFTFEGSPAAAVSFPSAN